MNKDKIIKTAKGVGHAAADVTVHTILEGVAVFLATATEAVSASTPGAVIAGFAHFHFAEHFSVGKYCTVIGLVFLVSRYVHRRRSA